MMDVIQLVEGGRLTISIPCGNKKQSYEDHTSILVDRCLLRYDLTKIYPLFFQHPV